jgi:transposase
MIKRFNVSESSISGVRNKFLKPGSFLPMPYTGRKSDITAARDEAIRAKIKENCDITPEKLISELGLKLTISALSRHLDKMDLSYKKRLDVVESRAEWAGNPSVSMIMSLMSGSRGFRLWQRLI